MRAAALMLTAALLAAPAAAQTPARELFGAARAPSAQTSAPLGSYARGCLAGAVAAAETAPGWQMMRLSRGRVWAHPSAIAFLERLSAAARGAGWPRLLVGDISQPRGGPMLSGHRSHQIGLDMDIWLRPGLDRALTRAERETLGAPAVVARDRRTLNDRWTDAHRDVLRAAALDGAVARIFVNPAIKAHLCRTETDRAWLRTLRPWWGHDAHFHVRLRCPEGATGCVAQSPPPPGPGCDGTLKWWFSEEARRPRPSGKPGKKLTLAELPPACAAVLDAE